VDGVTTNPSLIAKEGRVFEEVIEEITQIVDGPISAEVISLDAEGMLKEAEELVKIHPNIDSGAGCSKSRCILCISLCGQTG